MILNTSRLKGSSAIQHRCHALGRDLVGLRQQMGVGVEHGRRVVAEPRRDDVDRDAGSQRQGRGGVAKSVQRTGRDTGCLAVARKPVGEPVGMNRPAELVAEDQVAVAVGRSATSRSSSCVSRWRSSAATDSESSAILRRERDDLGEPKLTPPLTRDQLLLDREPGAVEVERPRGERRAARRGASRWSRPAAMPRADDRRQRGRGSARDLWPCTPCRARERVGGSASWAGLRTNRSTRTASPSARERTA